MYCKGSRIAVVKHISRSKGRYLCIGQGVATASRHDNMKLNDIEISLTLLIYCSHITYLRYHVLYFKRSTYTSFISCVRRWWQVPSTSKISKKRKMQSQKDMLLFHYVNWRCVVFVREAHPLQLLQRIPILYETGHIMKSKLIHLYLIHHTCRRGDVNIYLTEMRYDSQCACHNEGKTS